MHKLYRTINYIRAFGFINGIILFIRVELSSTTKTGNEISIYKLPGYSGEVHLRNSISDHAIFWQCLVMQQYDVKQTIQHNKITEKYQAQLSRGETPLIIDCGGNIGLATVWFAENYPKANICVVEPDSNNLHVLMKNIEPYGDRIRVYRGGIWYKKCDLKILNPEAGSAAFRLIECEEKDSSLSAFTIEDICKDMSNDYPLIVKLDIEGAQKYLFETNTEWVGKTNLITLELDDWLMPWEGTSRNFFSCVSKYPFDYIFHNESIFCFLDSLKK